nr:class I SAM-dependent methyltransferase [Aliikangiella sp. G2MR2-5]
MDFPHYQQTYRPLLDMLQGRSISLLDIGCGPGNVSQYLLAHHSELSVYGIDLSPQMVELAQTNNPDASFEVMDSRNISSISSKFDCIVCGFCIPYLSPNETLKLFRDIESLLNADGVLYLSCMEANAEQEMGIPRVQASSSGEQMYTYHYSFNWLKKNLLIAGLDLLSYKKLLYPSEEAESVYDLFLYVTKK